MKIKTTGTYAIAAVAAATVALLCFFRGCAVETVAPGLKARRGFTDKVWSRVRGAFNGAAASAENVRLRREVAVLALARSDVERLESENARLRRALEYTARSPQTWLPAAVLSKGGGSISLRRTVRTDKGSAAGVKKGAVVTVPEGLVGKVTAVTPHTSEVLLLTDPSLKVSCEVLAPGAAPTRGIITGGTDEMLVIGNLSPGREIPLRSTVYTSGLGGVFPKGIEIGTLLEIRKEIQTGPDYPGRVGEVLPSVDFTTLKDVFIRCEK